MNTFRCFGGLIVLSFNVFLFKVMEIQQLGGGDHC